MSLAFTDIDHISYWFRSGILQSGDRILAINGQLLEGMTLEDVRSIVKRSNHQIHLEIEFDVIGIILISFKKHYFMFYLLNDKLDSVMLSSGICEVKLFRKNLDLGLCVTCMLL